MTTEGGVDHAAHQQQPRTLKLGRRGEDPVRRILRGAAQFDGKARFLGAAGEVDGIHIPACRPAGARGIGLVCHVGDVRRRVDDGRRGHADRRRQIAAADVTRIPWRAQRQRFGPLQGAGRGIESIDFVLLRRHQQSAVRHERLRVNRAFDGRRPHLSERAAADELWRDRRAARIPARPQIVATTRYPRRSRLPRRHQQQEQQQHAEDVPGFDIRRLPARVAIGRPHARSSRHRRGAQREKEASRGSRSAVAAIRRVQASTSSSCTSSTGECM